ncbi:MAG: co-chaperone GroES [Planctomycetota bacterium]|nr:MAG: co-chaperone GroES [Planctomycetota bacterium]
MATKTRKTATKSAAKTNLTPMGDNVIVRRIAAEEMSAGGIVLPESAKEKPREGVVIAVGEGRMNDQGVRHAPGLKQKDHVIFSSYAGTEIKIDGEELLIVREDEILAVLG